VPRNGSGTYTLPAGNPVVTGTVISSTVHNNTMSDIADELTNSVDKDGQTVITGDIDFNGNAIILDVDADSQIEVSTDDRFDLTLGGVLSLSTTSAQTLLLDAIAKLTPTDSSIIVGNGTTFIAESGSTARQSLGVDLTTKGTILAGNGTAPAVLAAGTNDFVLTAASGEATGVKWASLATIYNPDFEEFLASGSYAIPASASYVYVEAIGGGGGGGGGASSSGGGGGGFNFAVLRVSDLSGPVTVTVGAGGAAGGAGGNTTFGTYLTARGGALGGAGAGSGGLSGDYTAAETSSWASGGGGNGTAGSAGGAGGSCIKGGGGGGGDGSASAGAGGASQDGGAGGAGSAAGTGTAGAQPGGGGGAGGGGTGGVGGAGRVRVWAW